MKNGVAYIGLMGLGTVGSGLVQLLQERSAELERLCGFRLEIRKILVRNLDRPRAVQVERRLLTTDAHEILNDPEVDVVVEVMGGVFPALDYILEALRRGKTVITANKELMADHGEAIFAAAEAGRADVFFEASVGGGIPVLRPLKESLAGNRLYRVTGIINGTTNYILTRMAEEGLSYQDVLTDAMRLGYAEADPTADVEGHDAARKLAILSSIAFHTRIRSADVRTEGITRITPSDIEYGRKRGWVLKLLAEAEERAGRVEARVAPVFIDYQHPLATVNDVLNAVLVEGDGIGETMFYGRGAGALPTGSAVLGDLIQAVRFRQQGVSFTKCGCYRNVEVGDPSQAPSRLYARVEVIKHPGLAADLVQHLEGRGIGLERMDYRDLPGGLAEVSLVTLEAPEVEARAAIVALAEHSWVRGVGLPILVAARELDHEAELALLQEARGPRRPTFPALAARIG